MVPEFENLIFSLQQHQGVKQYVLNDCILAFSLGILALDTSYQGDKTHVANLQKYLPTNYQKLPN